MGQQETQQMPTQGPHMQHSSGFFFQKEESSVLKAGGSPLGSVCVLTTTRPGPHGHQGHLSVCVTAHSLPVVLSVSRSHNHLAQPGMPAKKTECGVPLDLMNRDIEAQCSRGSYHWVHLDEIPHLHHDPRKLVLFTSFDKEAEELAQTCDASHWKGRNGTL